MASCSSREASETVLITASRLSRCAASRSRKNAGGLLLPGFLAGALFLRIITVPLVDGGSAPAINTIGAMVARQLHRKGRRNPLIRPASIASSSNYVARRDLKTCNFRAQNCLG